MNREGLFYHLFFVGTTKFKRVFWASYVLFYMSLIMLCKVGFETIYPIAPPLLIDDITVRATRTSSHVDLSYKVTYTAIRPVEGTVNMQIVHKDSLKTYDLPGMQSLYSGQITRQAIMTVPSAMPNGRYELKTWLIWRPTFSVSNHYTMLPTTEFDICHTKCDL